MKRKTYVKLQEAGITLVALVVTIIVLLILAGISISMVLGQNGLIEKTKDAKTNMDSAQIKERIELAYYSALTQGQGSYTKESLENELENEFGENNYNVDDSDNTNWILSAEGQSMTIPAGRIASTGKLISEIFEANGSTEGKMHIGDYIDYPVYYDNVPAYVKSDWGNQISGYSSIQDFVNDDDVKKYIADDSYNGWKLLSVEEQNDITTIKLISAGVPINYLFQNDATYGIRDLTVGFFDTQKISSLSDYGFCDLGFKQQNGTRVTNISDVKELFDNRYTLKYLENEIATYTNNSITWGKTTIVTNENVSGYPKVQSLTEEDQETLQLIPCKGEHSSYYVPLWYPSYGGTSMGGNYLAFCTRYGNWRDNDGTMKCIYGVSVVVTLKSDVRFILSNESNSTDTIKIWNLE